VASGLYHGVNPGMGWPLALSAGLMERSARALLQALWPLAVGHLLAMLLVMLPFAFLAALVEWQWQIRIGASLLVIAFGIFRLVNPRHPRTLARIPPTQLGLWSFAVGRDLCWCRFILDSAGQPSTAAMRRPAASLRATWPWRCWSLVHGAAMIAAGGVFAWLVYRHLGLKLVSRSWFNLDTTWALSLVLVGALSLAFSLSGQH
jgi:hypothetical protein